MKKDIIILYNRYVYERSSLNKKYWNIKYLIRENDEISKGSSKFIKINTLQKSSIIYPIKNVKNYDPQDYYSLNGIQVKRYTQEEFALEYFDELLQL